MTVGTIPLARHLSSSSSLLLLPPVAMPGRTLVTWLPLLGPQVLPFTPSAGTAGTTGDENALREMDGFFFKGPNGKNYVKNEKNCIFSKPRLH